MTAKARLGIADSEYFKDGMTIKFDGPINDWSKDDWLFIKEPTKHKLSLRPLAVNKDRLVVSLFINEYNKLGHLIFALRAELDPISTDTARLVLTKEDADILASVSPPLP